MKTKKWVSFIILFVVLIGFSSVSLGLINPEQQIVEAVSALENTNPGFAYILVEDDIFTENDDNAGSGKNDDDKETRFDTKVFRFLQERQVCALTEDQAVTVTQVFPHENKSFNVDGNETKVFYLQGNPINKKIIEKAINDKLDKKCQVVHGNKVAAIITPIFIS